MLETKVYVLLPVYNRKEITDLFVRQLLSQTHGNIKLVLIDDGSTDGVIGNVLNLMPDTIVIKGKGNWWWGGSLAQGYRWVKDNYGRLIKNNDYILIMNNDDVFSDSFVATGLSIISKLGQNRILLAHAYSQQTKQYLDGPMYYNNVLNVFKKIDPQSKDVCNVYSTNGLLCRVTDFINAGNFKFWFFPHYLSDYVWSYQAWKNGLLLETDPEFKLYINEYTTNNNEIQAKKRNWRQRYFSHSSPDRFWTWFWFVLFYVAPRYKFKHLNILLYRVFIRNSPLIISWIARLILLPTYLYNKLLFFKKC